MRGGRDERDTPAVPVTPRWRTAGLALGAALAVAATVVVFLTEDPQLLRLAVVGGAWAFVLALLAAGRRRPEPARDGADVRRAHDLEAEGRLRRESDDGMRAEFAALRRDVAALTALRSDLAALGALRQDVAALGALRHDMAALGALRAELAALGGLRQDVAALGALRHDMAALGALREDVAGLRGLRDEVSRLETMRAELGQLGDLRADVGRLRTELTEQLSSEMFLERIVMRTQSSRGPAGTVEGPGTRSMEAISWSDEPRELTGGWPAVRLESPAPEPEAPMTRGYDALRAFRAPGPEIPFRAPSPLPEPVSADPQRRRRTDPDTAEQLTVERPLSAWREPAVSSAAADLDAWPRPPEPLPPEPLPPESLPPESLPPQPVPAEPLTVQVPAVPTPGEARLAQILAESGATGSSPGGRRRHRYRDDDEDDDVLARVLGRH